MVVLGEVQEVVVHIELCQLRLAERIRVWHAQCNGQEANDLWQASSMYTQGWQVRTCARPSTTGSGWWACVGVVFSKRGC